MGFKSAKHTDKVMNQVIKNCDIAIAAGTAKFWVKASSPVFAYFFYYFLLDMAICPYLASIFGMPIWHPTKEAEVDELLNAQVQV